VIRTILSADRHGVTWIDVTAPSQDELHQVAERYGLPPTGVEDCLDPEHLPKYERMEDATFVILRVWDPQPDRTGLSIQDVTRKIALFARKDLLLTIHRADLAAIKMVEKDLTSQAGAGEAASIPSLFAALAAAALASYDKPMEDAEQTLGAFERAVFNPKRKAPDLAAIHQLKSRVGLMRRLLWLMSGVVTKTGGGPERISPLYQDMRDTAESYVFYADQLLDETSNLLSMHLAVASHRTNEVVRILTVFSAFFLPLTFIVGIYGMNFVFMPELKTRWGYPLVLAAMAAVSLTIFLWFRRRGWLRRVVD
jgi:magnesium transporter